MFSLSKEYKKIIEELYHSKEDEWFIEGVDEGVISYSLIDELMNIEYVISLKSNGVHMNKALLDEILDEDGITYIHLTKKVYKGIKWSLHFITKWSIGEVISHN